MNAYLIFAKEVKMAVLKENPYASQEDIDQLVHHRWRFILSSEEKRPYFDKAEKLRRDAAAKQVRRRERVTTATTTTRTATSTDNFALEPTSPSATSVASSSESDRRSTPSSPDSGCPSTPGRDGGVDAAPLPFGSDGAGGVVGGGDSVSGFGHDAATVKLQPPMGVFPLPNSIRPLANPVQSMVGLGGNAFGYHPMVHPMFHPMLHPMIHPAYANSYTNPYCIPTAPLIHPQMYYNANGTGKLVYPSVQSNIPFYGSYVGNQVSHPYFGMPMYQHHYHHPSGGCNRNPPMTMTTATPTMMTPSSASSARGEDSLNAFGVNDEDGSVVDDSIVSSEGERVACN